MKAKKKKSKNIVHPSTYIEGVQVFRKFLWKTGLSYMDHHVNSKENVEYFKHFSLSNKQSLYVVSPSLDDDESIILYMLWYISNLFSFGFFFFD